MHSHHSHSGQFCRHAAPNTTLEQSILAALARGLTTFGLSEHVPRYRAQDLYPEESDLTPADLERAFDEYLAEAHRLKREYEGRIDLLVGAETDYITPLDLERLEALLERCEVEYVVGSVHHVNEQGIDFSENWWRTCVAGFEPSPSFENGQKTTTPPPPTTTTPSDTALTAYFNTYLDAQHTLLTRIAPPIIGHFDLCRLYIPHTPLNDARRFPGVWDRVVRNIKEVVAYGGLFEVNAAAFRKGWDAAYPGTEILQVRPRTPTSLPSPFILPAFSDEPTPHSASSPTEAAYASQTTRTDRSPSRKTTLGYGTTCSAKASRRSGTSLPFHAAPRPRKTHRGKRREMRKKGVWRIQGVCHGRG